MLEISQFDNQSSPAAGKKQGLRTNKKAVTVGTALLLPSRVKRLVMWRNSMVREDLLAIP